MSVSTLKKTVAPMPEIGMDKNACGKVAKKLTGLLSTTYPLYMESPYYHRNVTGPKFYGLHTLFAE